MAKALPAKPSKTKQALRPKPVAKARPAKPGKTEQAKKKPAYREVPVPLVRLLPPAGQGVARQAALTADRATAMRRTRLRQVVMQNATAPVNEAWVAGAERRAAPTVQGLFSLSCEQGVFLVIATPLGSQPFVKFGLAQRVPTEWLLPCDEARACYFAEEVSLGESLQAQVYVAFIPLVALGEADIIAGEQLFGGQTISGQLITFSVLVEYYRKANPQSLAGRLLKLGSLFKQSFEKVLGDTHPLRKGFETLLAQKAQAEAEAKAKAEKTQKDAVATGTSHGYSDLPSLPEDLHALKDQFLTDPTNKSLAQDFGKKLLTLERSKGSGAIANEGGQGSEDDQDLEAFRAEKALFSFSLAVAQHRAQASVHKTKKSVTGRSLRRSK